MVLVKNRRIAADPWQRLADGDAIPADGPVLVTLARWQAERAALAVRGRPVGVILDSADPVAAVADDLDAFGLIAVDFPKFTDGRPYSTARLLRGRLGYGGELRAVGNVLRDQLPFMVRCGFDAFALPDGAPADRWLAALDEITVAYQPAADGRPTALGLRRAGPAAPPPAGEREVVAAMWAY